MRRLRVILAVAVGSLALAALARAQLPTGIVRPDSEQGLSQTELGSQLYAANCATCHGISGEGVTERTRRRGSGGVRGLGPPLRGVGARAAHFYLSEGFMPLSRPDEEPWRRRVLFNDRELNALVAYVASLAPGPGIPHPQWQGANVSEGLHLFTEHCAGCHQVVAEGGYVTDAKVPLIKQDNPTQIAEAVRTGPYLMPVFSSKVISDSELNSIIAYIQASKHPADRGGWGIGHIGPVPEGLVAWWIAMVALVTTCIVIGKRFRS